MIGGCHWRSLGAASVYDRGASFPALSVWATQAQVDCQGEPVCRPGRGQSDPTGATPRETIPRKWLASQTMIPGSSSRDSNQDRTTLIGISGLTWHSSAGNSMRVMSDRYGSRLDRITRGLPLRNQTSQWPLASGCLGFDHLRRDERRAESVSQESSQDMTRQRQSGVAIKNVLFFQQETWL